MSDILCHYGIKRRSGRYPYGSGDRPYQRENKQIDKKKKVVKFVSGKSLSKKELVSKNRINKDAELNLKKGDKVQHISGVDIDKLRSGQLYVTATDYDNKLYEAFLSGMLLTKGYRAKKVDLILKEDLRSPSFNKQYDLFRTKMDEETVIRGVAEWMVSKGKSDSVEKAIESESKKTKEEIYSDFINSCETGSSSRNKFYEILKSEGYNAVLDTHDRDSWISGKQPIIIMEALETVGSFDVKELSITDINEALKDWLEMNK